MVGSEIVLQFAQQKKGRILVLAPTNNAADRTAIKLKSLVTRHLPHLEVRRFSAENHLSSVCVEFCFLDGNQKHKMPACDIFTENIILVATVASAGRLGYTKSGAIRFSLILVDEAAYPLEYQISLGFMPLTQDKNRPHLVLLGDIHQISQQSWLSVAQDWPVNQSLFSRLMKHPVYNTDNCNKIILTENHRNPPRVIYLMNKIAYGGQIKAVGKHTGPGEVYAIHVQGGNQKTFLSNLIFTEAMAITYLVKRLQEERPSLTFQVITFYRAQGTALKQLFLEHGLTVPVHSAETAQGGETDVVVLSPSNLLMDPHMEGKGAWMQAPSRTLVALSRTKQDFYIVGNLMSSTSSPPLRQIIEEAWHQGHVRIHPDLKGTLEKRIKSRAL